MLFISSTIIHMRATQHLHRGLLLGTTRIKEKKFRETHLNIFGVFGFLEQANKREKQKHENYLHGKAPNKQKKNKEIFLGFLFNVTTKHA